MGLAVRLYDCHIRPMSATVASVFVGSIAGGTCDAQFRRLLIEKVANVPSGVGEFLGSILRSGAD
jgi:hypothetical protein